MQSLPAGGRYVKEDLVQQCLSDPDKTKGMVDELEHMDGNVGAVSQAITEVCAYPLLTVTRPNIHRLLQGCAPIERPCLSRLCSLLARKSSSLDIMLLFDKPITILQPICDLLDNWHYDEDQVEYQPVYEEFGSVLLLVLSFVYRYNLSTVDLGIRSSSSFVAKLLDLGHLFRAMENLTEQEQTILTVGFEVCLTTKAVVWAMSLCPPAHHRISISLFLHCSITLCLRAQRNNLSDEGLKGGLELFVEPFLLPSLIPAITWPSSHLWESQGE